MGEFGEGDEGVVVPLVMANKPQTPAIVDCLPIGFYFVKPELATHQFYLLRKNARTRTFKNMTAWWAVKMKGHFIASIKLQTSKHENTNPNPKHTGRHTNTNASTHTALNSPNSRRGSPWPAELPGPHPGACC